MPRAPALATLLAVAALAGGCGGTKTVTVVRTVTQVRTVTTAPATTTTASVRTCLGNDLTATFAVVPGSPGAGQISYRLRLTNSSQATCFVSGLPVVQLLDAKGAALPTQGRAAQAGQSTAARVELQPGASAAADARFSPDVAGTGDQQTGACEPTAATLRVTAPGGGSVDAAVDPPTAVCERGTLSFSVFAAA